MGIFDVDENIENVSFDRIYKLKRLYDELSDGASLKGEQIIDTIRVQNMPLDYTDAELKEDGVILECCPTSNINTAIYKSIEEFPYRIFMDNGVKFTISSDNMSVSNTSIKEEYIKLNETFNIKRTELLQLLDNSIDAAFITEPEKNELKKKIHESIMKASYE